MGTRRKSDLVATVVFSLALLSLLPLSLRDVYAGLRVDETQPYAAELRLLGAFGWSALCMIAIGTFTTWLGFINRVRWTWLVQFAIAGLWWFPLAVVPILSRVVKGRLAYSLSEWAYIAMHERGVARDAAEPVLIFVLMVIALLLSAVPLFWHRELQTDSRSPRVLPVALTVGVFVALAACFLWINLQQYEITPAELKSGLDVPAPPPPLPAKK